jgi:hydroxymethylbilane synthase
MHDMTERLLKIGTRGSPLALIQAELVRDQMMAAHEGLVVEIVVISTTGDRIQDRTLAAIGGKGLFTKEIEQALFDGTVDIAVHSAKDMLTEFPSGLKLGSILAREDTRDAIISRDGKGLDDLVAGSVIGTASLRRQAQILARRPDLKVVPFRGNVETRLRKLDEAQADATLLAIAGLNRLAKADLASEVLEPEILLPAVGQGAIALEIREDDAFTNEATAVLNDPQASAEVRSERAVLAVLDGSCRTPIAGLACADMEAGTLHLRALVAKPDGSIVYTAERSGSVADAEAIGREAGQELKSTAGPNFLP